MAEIRVLCDFAFKEVDSSVTREVNERTRADKYLQPHPLHTNEPGSLMFRLTKYFITVAPARNFLT
jgi:hypothetical protein